MSNKETFIMKPKVDFCFKELMEDAEIRSEHPEDRDSTFELGSFLQCGREGGV